MSGSSVIAANRRPMSRGGDRGEPHPGRARVCAPPSGRVLCRRPGRARRGGPPSPRRLQPLAVADEKVLRLEGAECAGVVESLQSERTPAGRPGGAKNRLVPDCLGDEERAFCRPPKGRSRCQRLVRFTGTASNGLSATASGMNGRAEPGELVRDRRAVPVVAVEELDDGRRLSQRAYARESRLEPVRIDEPGTAVARERVRRAGCRLVDDPREPMRPAVVAESDCVTRRAYVLAPALLLMGRAVVVLSWRADCPSRPSKRVLDGD